MRALLRRLLRPVIPTAPVRVAVWTASGSDRAARFAGRRRRALLLHPDAGDRLRQGRLAGAGPFAVVVDATGSAEGARRRFRQSFLHLQPGGSYVVPDPAVGDQVARIAADLSARRGGPFAGAVGEVTRGPDGLEVQRRGRTLVKLREDEMNAALETDPGRGRILTSVAAESFESRCALRESRPRPGARQPVSYAAPELFLREYRDVICRPKSVVEQRGIVTPDTFRHHMARRLRHKRLTDVGPRHVAAPARLPGERLEGTFFHLDNEIRGYFGHALTEQVSKLWAWPEVRRRHPEAKALVSLNRGRGLAAWEWDLLGAAGIHRDDVHVADQTVVVERLLAATPAFSMPHYLHPVLAEVWDQVGAALKATEVRRDWPARVFFSRRHGKRACLNRIDVEQLFARHGFVIVHPEDHRLAEQVAMVERAEVVAGFAGSGMFTTMFASRPTRLVLVTPETYRPSNEYMIASLRGHALDVAVGTTPPELRSPDSGTGLNWPFVLDMQTDGAWLASVLADL